MFDAVVSGTVVAGEPSRLGAGLLDVTVDSDPREPLPTRILAILEHWHTVRPVEKNLWAGYDRELRHHWVGRLPPQGSADPMSRRRIRLTPEGARRLGEALGVRAGA